MTGPEDSHSGTRPISVAELLAKNGTIGAPPVGGRRRRRRGNNETVTVAELTGEIPIVTDSALAADEDVDEEAPVTDQHPAITAPVSGATNGTARTAPPEPELSEAETDYEQHIAARDSEPAPLKFKPTS